MQLRFVTRRVGKQWVYADVAGKEVVTPAKPGKYQIVHNDKDAVVVVKDMENASLISPEEIATDSDSK